MTLLVCNAQKVFIVLKDLRHPLLVHLVHIVLREQVITSNSNVWKATILTRLMLVPTCHSFASYALKAPIVREERLFL